VLGIFGVSLLIRQEQNKKLSPSPLIVAACFDEQGKGVFIPHNFSYLHLGSIFFKCIISYNFTPQLFSLIHFL
jgi:hypothetical protein